MHWTTLLRYTLVVDVALCDYLGSDGQDANGHRTPQYSPARPPSIPLAVRSPYLSAWSTTVGNSTLNSGPVWFWSGLPLGWDGMITVDNVTYEYLGTGARSLQRISGLEPARPQTVTYDSHYSNFTFFAGPVEITASFFSPVLPKDICRSSIPMSYLTTSVRSLDNRTHHIRFYSDVNDAWIRRRRESALIWELVRTVTPSNGTNHSTSTAAPNGPFSWIMHQDVHYYMAELDEMAQWGNFTYSTAPFGAKLMFENGDATSIRYGFVTQGNLTNTVERDFGKWGGRESTFAFAHDFGQVRDASVRYTIGNIQTPTARYLYYGGVAQLAPWWSKCYGDMSALMRFHWNDFSTAQQLAAEFDANLKSDIQKFYATNETFIYSHHGNQSKPAGGSPPPGSHHTPFFPNDTAVVGRRDGLPKAPLNFHTRRDGADDGVNGTQAYIFDPDTDYGFLDARHNSTGIAVPDVSEADALYAIVALSTRQIMGAYIYAVPPPPAPSCAKGPVAMPEEPLIFQKEISSDGNLNTIDVVFPAAPFWLWANPEVLRYIMQPNYEMQEGTFYPNSYCAHDIGANFPNATGHVDGNDEYMPVEESGDFILLSYAYYKFSGGNAAWLTGHYKLLKQFAQYLIDFSLIPAAQLSTDDFAGTLANQTNLAIKGILGIQAMSNIARVAGQSADAAHFADVAHRYYQRWRQLAIDPSNQHALLAYQWRSSWGLLYNIFMDKLLDLGIVGDDVYAMQSRWYAQVSQVFGVPLDNRHHYTKSDWMMWTAATCEPSTRKLLVTSLAYWINYTTTEHPMADLFEVVNSGYYPQVPNDIRFKARPVVGGHFAILALARSGQLQGSVGSNTTGSQLGGPNGTLSSHGQSIPATGTGKPPPPTTVIVTSGSNTFTSTLQTTTIKTTGTLTTTKGGTATTTISGKPPSSTPPTGPPTNTPTGGGRGAGGKNNKRETRW